MQPKVTWLKQRWGTAYRGHLSNITCDYCVFNVVRSCPALTTHTINLACTVSIFWICCDSGLRCWCCVNWTRTWRWNTLAFCPLLHNSKQEKDWPSSARFWREPTWPVVQRLRLESRLVLSSNPLQGFPVFRREECLLFWYRSRGVRSSTDRTFCPTLFPYTGKLE